MSHCKSPCTLDAMWCCSALQVNWCGLFWQVRLAELMQQTGLQEEDNVALLQLRSQASGSGTHILEMQLLQQMLQPKPRSLSHSEGPALQHLLVMSTSTHSF